MRIDIKTAKILTSEEARETLLLFRNHGDDPLAIQESLRGMYPKKIAEALGELRQLRRRATQKFAKGLDMFFTREQLEQATSEVVAQYRAQRFKGAGFDQVYDACCGIGADTIAMAKAGLKVVASDKEPSAVHFAQANAEVYGVGEIEVHEVDCTAEPPPNEGPIFLDPSRRRGSRRIMSPDDWSPTPDQIAEMIQGRPGACVKLSPAVAVDLLKEKFPAPDEVEVISLRGEAKETVFWYGALASEPAHRATVLPAEESFCGSTNGAAEVGEVADYLFDPDPSLTCSGLLGGFASKHNLKVLDPEIGFLTGSAALESPFLDTFKVLAWDALDPRKMRVHMREHEVGSLEVRKRGITERPATLAHRFLPKPQGERRLTLLATKVGERHLGILGERVG